MRVFDCGQSIRGLDFRDELLLGWTTNTAHIWNLSTGAEICSFDEHQNSISGAQFFNNHPSILVMITLQLWETTGSEVIKMLKVIPLCQWSPVNRYKELYHGQKAIPFESGTFNLLSQYCTKMAMVSSTHSCRWANRVMGSDTIRSKNRICIIGELQSYKAGPTGLLWTSVQMVNQVRDDVLRVDDIINETVKLRMENIVMIFHLAAFYRTGLTYLVTGTEPWIWGPMDNC